MKKTLVDLNGHHLSRTERDALKAQVALHTEPVTGEQAAQIAAQVLQQNLARLLALLEDRYGLEPQPGHPSVRVSPVGTDAP